MPTSEDRRQEAWWRDGACAEIGSDLFFLEKGDSSREAKRICKTMCPVRAECLADALTSDLEYGVFGGYVRNERKPLMERVARGEDPYFVARDAIAAETRQAAS